MFYEKPHYKEKNKDQENDNGDSRMTFPILCTCILILLLRSCAFGKQNKTIAIKNTIL